MPCRRRGDTSRSAERRFGRSPDSRGWHCPRCELQNRVRVRRRAETPPRVWRTSVLPVFHSRGAIIERNDFLKEKGRHCWRPFPSEPAILQRVLVPGLEVQSHLTLEDSVTRLRRRLAKRGVACD